MKKAIVWLSYDLGVNGDYPGLYSWLDNEKARECGDSIAFIKRDASDPENMVELLKKDLKESVRFNKNDRIYVAFVGDDGSAKGRFIIGKRKAAPWQGYGDATTEEDH